jgi:HlyD family secretion protein
MKEVYVDFNSVVKKGELLALMDTSLFDADVQKSLASLKQQEAILYKDKQNYTRYKNLYNRNLVSRSEFEAAEATYKSGLAQLEQIKSTYKYNQHLLSFTKILSPVDGIVISRKVDPGQPVAASFQAPELFLVAKDLKDMQIDINISEADIGKVKEGQPVEYTLDGYPDLVFHSKVSQVRNSPTTVSNVVTYTVVVYVDNEDLKLKPGMTANVSIITEKQENVLCVPNEALKFTPEVGKKYETQGIWVLEKGKPVRKDITTGLSDDTYTQILSGSLTKGDKVILEMINGKNPKKQGARPPRMRMF